MWQHIGQSLEDVARRDADWDSDTGKVKRGLLESIGDKIRGYSAEDINKERQRQETKAVLGSKGAQAIQRMAGDNPLLGLDDKYSGYDYQTTREDIQSDLARAQRLDQAQDLARSLDVDVDTLSPTQQQNVGILASLGSKQSKKDEYESQPNVRSRKIEDENRGILAEERRLDRLDRAEGRRDSYQIRLDELDLRRQDQADKMHIYEQQVANQRADRKQQQMMALIQGLATLGTGFAL